MCKETLKISHPPIINPPPPRIYGSPLPLLVKISHLLIIAIFEKFHPPFMIGGSSNYD